MIAVLLIILFCYAAVSKLAAIQLFRIELGKSPLLGTFAPLLSWGVPASELVIALLLAFRTTRPTGLYLSLFLMTLFTGYIIIILNFSYYIPCSCGGILSGLSWHAHLGFNFAFLLLIIVGILLQPNGNYPNINASLEPSGEAENL